jgi:hypothetical protein
MLLPQPQLLILQHFALGLRNIRLSPFELSTVEKAKLDVNGIFPRGMGFHKFLDNGLGADDKYPKD